MKIHLHEVTKKEDQAGHFDIKSVEPAVMEMKVAEAEKATVRNLGSLLELQTLTGSSWLQVLHRLQYDSGSNKIMSGYPGVYVKKPLRIKKGDAFNLLS